jgi:hypothetical protein
MPGSGRTPLVSTDGLMFNIATRPVGANNVSSVVKLLDNVGRYAVSIPAHKAKSVISANSAPWPQPKYRTAT